MFLLRRGLISTCRIGFINILYNFGFQNSYDALSLSLSCTGFRSTFLFRKILAFLRSNLALKIHTLLPLLLVGNFFCSWNWKGHWNSNGMPCGVTLGFKATWNNFVTEETRKQRIGYFRSPALLGLRIYYILPMYWVCCSCKTR